MKGVIFTFLLTAAGAVGGLLFPFFGLLVYICFAIVRPEFMWFYSLPQGNYSRIVGVALLAGWAITGFGSWKLGKAWPIVWCMIAYWVWSALSTIQSPQPEKGWDLLVFFLKVFLPFLVGVTTLDSVNKLKALAWVLVVSSGYTAFELYLLYRNGYQLQEDGWGGMDNNCVAIALVSCVGLAFFLAFGTKSWFGKAVAFGSALLMANAIMFSYSRGGMLALAITGVVSFFLIPKGPVHYTTFAIAVAVGIYLAGPKVQERFWTMFANKEGALEASAESRVKLWEGCIDATIKRPVLGVGPDQWGLIAPEYLDGQGKPFPLGKEAHSLWMQNLAEVGIPGTLFLLCFFLLTMYYLWPLTREQTPVPDPWLRDAARMAISALTGFVISAQFVTIKYLEVPFYVVLLGAGVLRVMAAASPTTPSAAWLSANEAPNRPPQPAAAPSGFLD